MVLWAVVICLYAAVVSLAAGAVFALPMAVRSLLGGNPAGAVFMLGAALACAGLAILLFYCCGLAAKGVLKLTGKMALGIKSIFVGKKETEYVYA